MNEETAPRKIRNLMKVERSTKYEIGIGGYTKSKRKANDGVVYIDSPSVIACVIIRNTILMT